MDRRVPCRNAEERRKISKRHYENNREHYLARNRSRKKETREWLQEIKSVLKCENCGEGHIACLVFHHRDPTEKEIIISRVATTGWGRNRILSEMTKCQILCRNCHNKLHIKKRNLNVALSKRPSKKEVGVDLEILGGTNSGQGASREYYQRYYQEHKEKMELQRRERRVRVMKWLDDYKISSGCMRCAEEDAACLEFHHKDQNEKEFNITETVYRWSLKRVQEEVQKCEVVCANCHAILHCDEYHSHS